MVGYDSNMPVVSSFLGIIVRMFYQEHGVAHFHAEYQGERATFTFDGKLLAGTIRSRTARRLIEEWARSHRKGLSRTGNGSRRASRLIASSHWIEEPL